MHKFDVIKKYRYSYKNWLSVLINLYKKQERILIIYRNGKKETKSIENVIDYASNNYYKNCLKVTKGDTIKYQGKELKLYGSESNGDIQGIFFNDDYRFLAPKNHVVIDIGANIGDSAIYFALNGARSVIAFEPFPYSYRNALKNINENHLNKNIILINAGYDKDSGIIVDDSKVSDVGSLVVHQTREKK
jgi:hypothetical protein